MTAVIAPPRIGRVQARPTAKGGAALLLHGGRTLGASATATATAAGGNGGTMGGRLGALGGVAIGRTGGADLSATCGRGRFPWGR